MSYNGWKNWATWYAGMIIGDAIDSGDDTYFYDIDGENVDSTYELAQNMKNFMYAIVLDDIPTSTLAYEFADYALEQIDFQEIAEAHMEDYHGDDIVDID